MGFLGGASGKEHACQCRRCKRCRFDPWVRKITRREAQQPPPVFLPGESHGQSSLMGYSPWGFIESDMTEAAQHACQSFIRTQIFTTHYPLFCFLKMQISLWHHFDFLQFDNFLQYFCSACVLTMNSAGFLKCLYFPFSFEIYSVYRILC